MAAKSSLGQSLDPGDGLVTSKQHSGHLVTDINGLDLLHPNVYVEEALIVDPPGPDPLEDEEE